MARVNVGRLYEELLELHGRAIAEAFRRAVETLQGTADLQRVISALERRDLAEALEALHIDSVPFNEMLDALSDAFAAGGQNAIAFLPAKTPEGIALAIRFDTRNVRAEDYLRRHGAELVSRVVEDVRTAARQKLITGMERGDAPRRVALDVIGRINRASGKRDGGVLGLTAQQERAAQAAEDELRSGDAAALRSYLARAKRDRRFDRSVQKAIREGGALSAETVTKAATQYRNRLLQLRGETIARTEALTALNAAQFEALLQAVETGKLRASQIRRVWRSAGDRRVRDTHAGLHGDTAGLTEAFQSPSGATLRFPGDPLAPAAERINCRCWTMPRVDWAANLR